MLLRRGFCFLLKPTPAQRQFFACSAGCARLVWNTALALQKQRLADKLPLLKYQELSPLLKLWKSEKPFLKEAPSQAFQQKLMDLSRAIDEAKDPSNPKQFPVFKKKGEGDSFRYPQHVTMEQEHSRILLPKLGWVRYVNSQEIVGKVKNVTITLDAGRWYVSIQTEQEVEEPKHPSTSMVGCDLGVVHFLTLSDGTHFDAPDYKPLEQKVKREQRKLSRKRKGGQNYQKQKLKLQRAHKKLRDRREDFQHKLSTNLSKEAVALSAAPSEHAVACLRARGLRKNHAVIVVEKLRVKQMTKSARGTIEEPGTNVRQKAGLNRSILRQGWSEFKRQLKYKCEWRGGRYREVEAAYTSQSCCVCHYVSASNRKAQAAFVCERCGHAENADQNAAKNILAQGLLELAKPQEEKKKKQKKRTAGRAGIACCETVSSSSQKRIPKALEATT